jgi:hypothetical protein
MITFQPHDVRLNETETITEGKKCGEFCTSFLPHDVRLNEIETITEGKKCGEFGPHL